MFMMSGAPAGFLPRVHTVFFFFFFGGGVYNGKVIIFRFVFYKVNLEKRLEHFLFVKCTFFSFLFLK